MQAWNHIVKLLLLILAVTVIRLLWTRIGHAVQSLRDFRAGRNQQRR